MITKYEVFVPPVMGCGASLQTGLQLKKLGCTRVLVVYDKGLEAAGISGTIVENIEESGVEVVVFDRVQPDPPDILVEEAAQLAREASVDGIVAIGGGSSMDTAKGINVLMNNPPPIMQYFGVRKDLKEGLPLVAIPTTSGTGSETTNMTVISCTSLEKKDSVVSPVCVPTLAILDPELTLGLPAKMTAATGVDALAHAVESITGAHANPLSDALSREAIRLIQKWLPIAYADGSHIEARTFMLYSSYLAGMAFTNALVHLGHSIGHTVGAVFHIPHGLACAATLPEVVRYASRTESHKVAMICEALGVELAEDAGAEEIGDVARDALRRLLKAVDIPNLQELGIEHEALMKVAPMVTQDTGMALVPYRVTASHIAEMLSSAYDA